MQGQKEIKKQLLQLGRLDTVQIRIANIVKELNRDEEPLRKQAIAYAEEDRIIIE